MLYGYRIRLRQVAASSEVTLVTRNYDEGLHYLLCLYTLYVLVIQPNY